MEEREGETLKEKKTGYDLRNKINISDMRN